MMRNPLYFIALLLLFSACSDATVFDKNLEIEPAGWHYESPARFDIPIEDTSINYDLSINLRIRPDYPYSNIFVLVHHAGPAKDTTTQRINFELARSDGKWLGKSSGDLISYEFPVFKNVPLSAGTHTYAIEQNMRTNTLGNVVNVGLKVQKGEKKF